VAFDGDATSWEYPLDPADRASVAETADGIRAAAALIDAAAKILPNLGLF
jgi:hypothetical protein